MPYFNWSQEFSVENRLIDEQHKMIFEYTNKLHDAIQRGKSKEIVDDLIIKLVDYSRNHFADEEMMMENSNYPDIGKHIAEHDEFIAKVTDYRNNFNLSSMMTAIDILNFLKDWLTNHILVTDKKYAPYLKGRGAK